MSYAPSPSSGPRLVRDEPTPDDDPTTVEPVVFAEGPRDTHPDVPPGDTKPLSYAARALAAPVVRRAPPKLVVKPLPPPLPPKSRVVVPDASWADATMITVTASLSAAIEIPVHHDVPVAAPASAPAQAVTAAWSNESVNGARAIALALVVSTLLTFALGVLLGSILRGT